MSAAEVIQYAIGTVVIAGAAVWLARGNAFTLLSGKKTHTTKPAQNLNYLDSITYDEFEADVYMAKQEDGGRKTPFFNGYKPEFQIDATDIPGKVQLPKGVEMAMPGDHVQIKVKLAVSAHLHEGLHFTIREAGRAVGSGTVTIVTR